MGSFAMEVLFPAWRLPVRSPLRPLVRLFFFPFLSLSDRFSLLGPIRSRPRPCRLAAASPVPSGSPGASPPPPFTVSPFDESSAVPIRPPAVGTVSAPLSDLLAWHAEIHAATAGRCSAVAASQASGHALSGARAAHAASAEALSLAETRARLATAGVLVADHRLDFALAQYRSLLERRQADLDAPSSSASDRASPEAVPVPSRASSYGGDFDGFEDADLRFDVGEGDDAGEDEDEAGDEDGVGDMELS